MLFILKKNYTGKFSANQNNNYFTMLHLLSVSESTASVLNPNDMKVAYIHFLHTTGNILMRHSSITICSFQASVPM